LVVIFTYGAKSFFEDFREKQLKERAVSSTYKVWGSICVKGWKSKWITGSGGNSSTVAFSKKPFE